MLNLIMPPCFLMYLSKYVSLGCYHSFSKTTRCGNEHERYNTQVKIECSGSAVFDISEVRGSKV